MGSFLTIQVCLKKLLILIKKIYLRKNMIKIFITMQNI